MLTVYDLFRILVVTWDHFFYFMKTYRFSLMMTSAFLHIKCFWKLEIFCRKQIFSAFTLPDKRQTIQCEKIKTKNVSAKTFHLNTSDRLLYVKTFQNKMQSFEKGNVSTIQFSVSERNKCEKSKSILIQFSSGFSPRDIIIIRGNKSFLFTFISVQRVKNRWHFSSEQFSTHFGGLLISTTYLSEKEKLENPQNLTFHIINNNNRRGKSFWFNFVNWVFLGKVSVQTMEAETWREKVCREKSKLLFRNQACTSVSNSCKTLLKLHFVPTLCNDKILELHQWSISFFLHETQAKNINERLPGLWPISVECGYASFHVMMIRMIKKMFVNSTANWSLF